MGARLRSHGTRRWLIAGLLLPALLLRAAIPAGLMPVFDRHGGFALQLCPGVSGAGGVPHHHADQGQHGTQRGDTSGGSHGALCPFALSAGPALAGTISFFDGGSVVASLITGDVAHGLAAATIE